MEKMKLSLFNKKIQLSVVCVFSIFFALVLLQHRMVYLGFDDFGYASLTYVHPLENFSGHSYNFSQAIQYLYGHYIYWGGRVLYFGFELLFLRFGINVMRIAQSLVIVGICYTIYTILKNKYSISKWIIAVLSCFIFFLLQIEINGDGTYWFTASVLYLWPLLPLFTGTYLFNQYLLTKNKSEFPLVKKIIICILVFIASFSQEQIAFSVLIMIALMIVLYYFKSKKLTKFMFFVSLSAIIGFLILYIAPGNYARQVGDLFYEKSFIAKLFESIPRTLYKYFSKATFLFQLVLYICCTYSSLIMIKNKKRGRIINIVFLGIAVFLFILLITNKDTATYLLSIIDNEIIVVLILLFSISCVFFNIVSYIFFIKKDDYLLSLSIGGVASMIPMLYAPYFVDRAFTPMLFLLTPFLISVIFDAFNLSIVEKLPLHIFLCFILVASGINYFQQLYGYYRNSKSRELTHQILTETAKRIDNGEVIESVTVYKNENDRYTGLMPYNCGDGQPVFEYNMKKYYDLPLDIQFNWVAAENIE